jgi:hypothetical protein
MFNEILTGQKTLEQPKAEQAPYRPDPGPSDLVCTSCQMVFPASQAIAGRCRNCAPNVDAALNAMRGPKADYTDYASLERNREVNWQLISVGISIVLAIVFALVKSGVFFHDEPDYYEVRYNDPYR